MSLSSAIGGRLREGNFRSRQVTGCIGLVGLRPRKGDWSDLWIGRHHEAPSDLA
jgi:hypothetical protein